MAGRITSKRVGLAVLAAKKYFGIVLTETQARDVLRLDDDNTVIPELDAGGHLDTAPRDYFAMLLIEYLMPGPPAVRDGMFLGANQDRWHWPCFGSDQKYTRAFVKALKAAAADRGVVLMKRMTRCW